MTTIGGTLDIHIYDVARIESLSGPQGTLYGASSEAGTIRIITNKPELGRTYGRVDGEINSVAHGSVGGKAEVDHYCGAANYGQPFCIYPWYTLGKNNTGYHYGVDYPNQANDFGQADQFTKTLQCGGPFGPNSTYCSTILE